MDACDVPGWAARPRRAGIEELRGQLSLRHRAELRMVDAVNQRICVAMNELPVAAFVPEDPCHSQRPVLFGEFTDGAELSLDDDEHRQVS